MHILTSIRNQWNVAKELQEDHQPEGSKGEYEESRFYKQRRKQIVRNLNMINLRQFVHKSV